MKADDDLMPLKAVVQDLGVSRTTLWRAARSDIAGFPAPTIVRRLVYWRRDELERLEDALMRYRGRVKFEQGRNAQQRIERLKKQVRPREPRAADTDVAPYQLWLFGD